MEYGFVLVMRRTTTTRPDQPSVEEVDWRELVRASGSILSGYRPTQIHHPAGRTAKQNKQAIGHRFILPLCATEHHLVDEGRSGLIEIKDVWWAYQGPGDFDLVMELSLHEFEKYLFGKLCLKVPFPFGDENYQAIMEWQR